MQYRHLFPMVRILLPFMAGIIVCLVLSASKEISFYSWASLLLLSIAAGFLPIKSWRFVKQWLFGVLVSLFLFVTGYNTVILHKEILRPGHFSKTQLKGAFIASVSEPLQEKDHSFKTILSVKGIKRGNRITEAEGRILTYFAKDSIKTIPAEGSTIVFSATVQEILPPQNPGAFDYRKYMATNNVYNQVYLNSQAWKTVADPQGFSVFRMAHEVSAKFVQILHNNGLKGKEFAVASALMLGQNDMLDNETLQAYSGSGVMHILSVSGLHVGVIYIVINFLLGFMRKKGAQLYLKTALIIITIWAYALLTGLSPSVMRAAAMFTFISVGNASRRYVHIINSLAVSAILLLLIDPLMISNVGFQLSYLAIIGIVFINEPIANLWNPTNRIAENTWDLISVSLAAQISTAPLAMLYFHQFPMYFIPANLIAIPVSFLAIYSGLSVLVTSFIPLISNFLGMITNFLFYILNITVSFIEKLPYSVLHVSAISAKEMFLFYMIILSVLLLIYFKRKELVFLTLSLILLLSVSFTATELIRLRQQKIVFYSAGKQSAVGFINGKSQILLADSALIIDKKANRFQFDGAKTFYGVESTSVFAFDTIGNSVQKPSTGMKVLRNVGDNFLFLNKRIAILNTIPKPAGNCNKLKVDYLVIRKNPKLKIHDLLKLYQPALIIIDGSVPLYSEEKWLAEFKKAGVKAYSIRDSGALTVDL